MQNKITPEIIKAACLLKANGTKYADISNLLSISMSAISKYTINVNNPNIIKYKYNLSIFDNNDAKSYYLLGAFITDGHIDYNPKCGVYRANLTSSDIDWLQSIIDLISPGKKLNNTTSSAKLIILSNKHIVEWFMQKGCLPCKSLTVKFPCVPDEFLIDFIRGCMDGDGCFCIYNAKDRKNPRAYSYIASASEEFIQVFKEKVKTLGINGTINKCKLVKPSIIRGRQVTSKHNLFRLHFSKLNTIKLCKVIYYENCLCMPRKLNKALQILSMDQ